MYSPDRLDATVWAATDLLLQDMKGYAFYEVARRRAAGETLEQIAGIAQSTPEREKKPSLLEIYKQALRRIKNPVDQCQADPEIVVLVDASNYLSCRVALLPRAISALIRCTTLVPVRHSRAVLRMPLPLASAERIAASFVAPILARPIGLPLLVPLSRALASPACIRS